MFSLKSAATLVVAMMLGTAVADEAPTSWDGLVEVKPRKMDAVFLLPGADFRAYTKVMIDPTDVAFRKDWMKEMNQPGTPMSRRVSDDDAAKILEAARSNFDDVFQEAFTKAGYTVVKTPGPDVLRVSTAVVNLYLNAPDTMPAGRSRTFTANAGEATLVIEVRDSPTNALLGRVIDRRETMDSAGMQMATSVSNLSDFRMLFKQWATTTANGLDELKAHSPVPLDLKPKQKL
jgi:hypothetical protein